MEEHPYTELTGKIIQCFYRVYDNLGPGFLESIYQKALIIELENAGLKVESEKIIELNYDNREIGVHKLDLIVENKVIVEVKATDTLIGQHKAQLISYLRATKLLVGLLVNFGGEELEFKRVENFYLLKRE